MACIVRTDSHQEVKRLTRVSTRLDGNLFTCKILVLWLVSFIFFDEEHVFLYLSDIFFLYVVQILYL